MRIWRCDKRKVSDATTPFYVLSEKVPHGFWLVVEQVAAKDVITACDSIRVGIWSQGKFFPVVSEDTVIADEIYYAAVTMRLKPPERVAFEFIGTESGNELYGWAYGVEVKYGESYIAPGHWTGR